METVTIRSRSPSPNAVSMSPSMATTFEPELQSIMTDKETEEMISRDSKFRERYSTQIPKLHPQMWIPNIQQIKISGFGSLVYLHPMILNQNLF